MQSGKLHSFFLFFLGKGGVGVCSAHGVSPPAGAASVRDLAERVARFTFHV